MTLTKAQVLENSLTRQRLVLIRFLESFFEETDYFTYDRDDLVNSEVAVLDAHSDLSQVPEHVHRVILQRGAQRGRTLVTDKFVSVDREKFHHTVVKPRLGSADIYCESRGVEVAEFLAAQVESALAIHGELMKEQGVEIGEPSSSDVRDPLSRGEGTRFYSMVVSVPTMVAGTTSYTTADPTLLDNIEMQLGIENNVPFHVEADSS